MEGEKGSSSIAPYLEGCGLAPLRLGAQKAVMAQLYSASEPRPRPTETDDACLPRADSVHCVRSEELAISPLWQRSVNVQLQRL